MLTRRSFFGAIASAAFGGEMIASYAKPREVIPPQAKSHWIQTVPVDRIVEARGLSVRDLQEARHRCTFGGSLPRAFFVDTRE